jgi:epsilon-lactone hydrolase
MRGLSDSMSGWPETSQVAPSPEMSAWIAEFQARMGGGFPVDLQARRAAGRRLAVARPIAADIVFAAADVGGVPCEWAWRADVTAGHVLLYLHGGGYVSGSAANVRPFAGALSAACRAHILAPDYRLAPEDPFPAAVEDAVACYSGLIDTGTPSSQIVIGGASAGGGLAVAALLVLRERGLPLPAGCLLASPWLDLALTSASMRAEVCPEPLITWTESRRFAELYLAGHDPRDPLASPLYASLRGLPPMHIELSRPERVADEVRAFAGRAASDGVEVSCVETPGAIHAFVFNAPTTPEAAHAYRRVAARCADWLRP